MSVVLSFLLSVLTIFGPVLKVDGGRFVDIGNVKIGTVVSHEFVIKNEGNEPLIIEGLGKSCNCTEVSMESKIIKPGESSKLLIKVNTEGKFGRTSINVFIRDNSEDGENFVQLLMNCVE